MHMYSKLNILLVIILFALCIQPITTQAQRRRRTKKEVVKKTNAAPAEVKQLIVVATQPPPSYDTVIIPATGNNFASPALQSLRPDGITEDQTSKIRDRTPLPYQPIRDEDAVYKEKLWRVIDTREKMNQSFNYKGLGDDGDQRLFSILYRSIVLGQLTAFEDDRFSRPISKEAFIKYYTGGYDTLSVHGDLNNPDKITSVEVREIDFPIDSVYRYMIKEEVVFDKQTSRLYIRVIGIAPMMPPLYKGRIIEGVASDLTPKFWIYYPDIRPILAKYNYYNPYNSSTSLTWDQVFDMGFFSSYIVKTSLNNPNDEFLSQYIPDPLMRLYEGQKIENRIFDYEQSLWAY